MTTTTAKAWPHIFVLAALACFATTGCDGADEKSPVVEREVGSAGPQVDLEAYAEQRLANGAVTLIDAAVPDGTLMPAAHSGPTWGELEQARRERERAAAEARAEETQAEADVPARAEAPAPRPAPPVPAPPAPPVPPAAPAAAPTANE